MMGVSAWRTLHSDRGILENKIERRTLRRVIGFSRPHRKLIGLFLVGTVLDAGLVVVPPLLIARLIDDGIRAGDVSVVVWLAVGIAAAARRGRTAGSVHRIPVSAHRRGPDLRPAHPGLRPRATPVAGVLHPHPDRRSGQPAELRRDRCPERVHLDAVRHGLQHRVRRRRRHHDARAQLAGHRVPPAAVPPAAADLALGEPPDGGPDPHPHGRQRRHGHGDDRAVQRRWRDAAQAVRAPRDRGRALRGEGRERP